MKFGLSFKLFLTILAACALVLVINGAIGRYSFKRDFLGYLNDQGVERMHEVLPRVASAYEKAGDWDFARKDPESWFQLMHPPSIKPPPFRGVPPVSDQTGAILRFAVLDMRGDVVVGNANAAQDAIRLPVTAKGQQVGWLAMVPFQRTIAAGDVRFYDAQVRAWWFNGVVSVLIAALLAFLLTSTLLKRLKTLTQFVHKLTLGDYSQRIPPRNRDEFDQLASDISQLASKLENIEHNRRAFMADISHELRTPLAVLKAELEAVEDGIRPMSPATLAPLQSEVNQLNKLVDDLYDLAVTQTGQFSYAFDVLDVNRVLNASHATMLARASDANLSMQLNSSLHPVFIRGDENRIQQLLSNLLENAIRYTDQGGQVRLQISSTDTAALICIEDSAPGVDAEARLQLFERFYRVEASRSRASGGSGLGLAICRNIVESHHGSISAHASVLGGLRIEIRLPLLPAS